MADFVAAQYAVDEIKEALVTGETSGLPPSNMRMMSAVGRNGKILLKFSAPNDTVIDDQTLCTVNKVMVRRKAGSAPTGLEDGTLVLELNRSAMNNYASTPYEDTGLTNGTQYYYRFFSCSDHGIWNVSPENICSGTPREYVLLGFKISKSESDPEDRVIYTDGAVGLTPAAVNLSTGVMNLGSFSDFWFVTGNKPVMLNADGTEAYELDPNDYTKKKDGTASDISNTSFNGNGMSKIPLVWIKMWEDANYEYCQFCDMQLDENFQADAFTRSDGTIGDCTYLSLFEGSLVSNKLRSIKGQTPINSKTGANELTYAQANGSGWSTRSWSQRNLINMLLILMAKSTDTQTAYGYGYYTGGSQSSPNYLTTGGASDKGQFYGKNANRDYVKVFHIENWWGDVWERIEGMVTNSNSHILVKTKPPYNTAGTGYTDTGVVPSGTSGGYISACKMTAQGLIPKTASGSETTYYTDGLWYAASCYARVGGSSANGFHVGALCLGLDIAVSGSGWSLGAALSCEQPNAA